MRLIPVEVGTRFGRLRVVQEVERTFAHRRFSCQCECGTLVVVHLSALRSKLTTSCGCWRKERATRHGAYKSTEYRAWADAIDRCSNPNNRSWKNYGGRGISVCDEWRDSFEAFYAHIGPRPSPRHSVDRYPNNDGNYEPGNVRWATTTEQARNRRKRSSYLARVFKPSRDKPESWLRQLGAQDAIKEEILEGQDA